jgi:transcriptional regulator with XRE-family HTH domain
MGVSDKTHRLVCVQIVRLLQEERERKKLSRYAVAARSGLSEQMVGYVERRLRNPSLETVVRLAGGIGVDLASIIKRAYESVKLDEDKGR